MNDDNQNVDIFNMDNDSNNLNLQVNPNEGINPPIQNNSASMNTNNNVPNQAAQNQYNNVNQMNIQNNLNQNSNSGPINQNLDTQIQPNIQTNNNESSMKTNPNNVKPKKKSKAPIIILITFLLFLLIGGIVSFIVFFKGGSGPKKVAKNYVENIINKNYQQNYKLVYLPEYNFVEEKQYLNFLNNNDYSMIESSKINSIQETYKTADEIRYIITTKKSSGLTVKNLLTLKLDYNKKWKVIEEELYFSNWRVIIPKNTKLYFNDKEVSEKLIKNSSNLGNLEVMYEIPALAKEKYTLKLENDLGVTEEEITPTSSNNGDTIYMELTDKDIINKAHEYIKNSWNSMYNAYLSGTNVSDVYNTYVDSDTLDLDSFNTIYLGFNSLANNYTYTTERDFNITEVVNKKIEDYDDYKIVNYIIDNDKITLNFGYRLNWVKDFKFSSTINSDNQEMTRYSKIRLKIVGDSFKIYEIPDTKLFSYSSNWTKEY